MRVLLSIKPIHVENILNGSKTFEFRRKIFTRSDVKSVVIYSTKPVGRIVAEFDIDEIMTGDPESIWNETYYGSGISKAFFDEYFLDRPCAYAIKIGKLRIFDQPIIPSNFIEDFTPPQSYQYIKPTVSPQRSMPF